MSQSSPEGIILGKGSKIISASLSINKEVVFEIKKPENKWNKIIKLALKKIKR